MLVTATRSATPPDYVCQEPDYSVYMYTETVAVVRAVIKKAQKSCFLFFPSRPEIVLPVPVAGVGWFRSQRCRKSSHFLFCMCVLCSGLAVDGSTAVLFFLRKGNFLNEICDLITQRSPDFLLLLRQACFC